MSAFESAPVRKENNESQEQISSKIVMHFFRHAKQGPMGPDGKDETRALTSEGEMQALAASAYVINPSLAKAITSPRVRAMETGSIVMDGADVLNRAADSGKPVPESVRPGFMGGARIEADDRLNFFSDQKSKTGHAMEEAYGKQQTLKFMLEDSDRIAKENGETGETTYSRAAAAVASVIRDFVVTKDGSGSASDRWNDIAQKDATRTNSSKRFQEPVLERFFASHQTMTESFLAKVIDKTKGREERTRFAEALGNAGFGFAEGYDVEVKNTGGAKEMTVRFNKKDKEGNSLYAFETPINAEMIEEIIKEGEL